MSKIFDAYKKSLDAPPSVDDAPPSVEREQTEFKAKLTPPGPPLFPALGTIQMGEMDKLASRLLPIKGVDKGVVLGFASSTSGEGASFVSFHAAMVLAQTYGQKVIWIDANFLSPQESLINDSNLSLGDLLYDPSLASTLGHRNNPLVIPAGRNLLGRRGLFASDSYRNLLDILSRQFDYTILDFPAILKTTDTALMAAETDGLLLVVEQKYLKREVINYGVQGLIEKGVQVLGTVLNKRKFELPKTIYNRL
jgi:protein-tyrosine kinase